MPITRLLLASFWLFLQPSTAASGYLNLTAIAAANNASTLECWQLFPQIATSSQAGTSGAQIQQLGNLSTASYSILPALFNGGAHNAPAVQYVAFLSGLAHITLPHSSHEAYILGGKHGLIIAADTAAVSAKGHLTNYPSDSETTALQLETQDGKIPPHRVLHAGPCFHNETEV